MISVVASSVLCGGEIRLGCDRFDLFLNDDASLGRLVPRARVLRDRESIREEASKRDSPFTLELQESVYGLEDGKRRFVALDTLSQAGDSLTLRSSGVPDIRLTFDVIDKKDYLTLHLVEVETPKGEHATRMEFKGLPPLRSFPLNPEVILQRNGNSIVFQGLLQRSAHPTFGGIALWYPETDDIDDQTLYRVWVDEGLPHPKVDGEWTVERAKEWVADCIETFRNYSEIYISGESLDELKRCVDYAAGMKMANVYMHLMTWAGRYWPEGEDLYRVNPRLFPNGHADFRELVDYAQARGLGVGTRTLSNGISLKSGEFIGNQPDRRLAHFWRGTLVDEIGPPSDTLRILSDRTLPTSFTARGFGTKTNPPSIKFLLIDDEILQYADHEEHEDGSITLQVARGRDRTPVRGYGQTEAAAHLPGAPVKILSGHFRDHVSPDHDSELLDEIAQRYADFNNEMDLATSSFDGLYLYTFHTQYGATKLPGAVYSHLDHPTWCTTSNGPPKWGYFEIHFNSVRRALGLDVDSLGDGMKIPQRMRLMIGLHQDHWPAPSPYGHTYCIVPHAVAGNMWCSVQDQSNTHEFTPTIFEDFGLLDHFATAIQRWRTYGPALPDRVKKRIWSAYEDGSVRYPFQVEHFRFEENGNGLDVVPFRPMRRPVGDRGWGYIQEHGPVYTYQYIRPNNEGLVQAENPYHEQVPEFIFRVMKDFERDAGEAQGKYRLMPPLNGRGLTPGKALEATVEENGLRVSCQNKTRNEIVFDAESKAGDHLLSYKVNASIENAQGMGVVIHGDGSNAVLVARIMNRKVRDYAIPIDFKGKRYVEIPSAQAGWSDSRIPITRLWKRWGSPKVSSVAVGFARVPARTRASVLVEDLRLLPERPSPLVKPIVHCGNGSVSINGTIPSDRHVWYKGGSTAEVFDLNWNKLADLPVTVADAEVPRGRSNIRVENHNDAGAPWLECQFFVKDKPIHMVTDQVSPGPP